MFTNNHQTKTWITLYAIVSALFSIIGLVMINIDNNYFTGTQYVITAAIYATAIFLIKKKNFKPNFSNPMLNLGFIFSVIGLSNQIGPGMHMGIWSLGIIFFIYGFFNKE